MSNYEFDSKCEYEQVRKFVCKFDSWELISLQNLLF